MQFTNSFVKFLTKADLGYTKPDLFQVYLLIFIDKLYFTNHNC